MIEVVGVDFDGVSERVRTVRMIRQRADATALIEQEERCIFSRVAEGSGDRGKFFRHWISLITLKPSAAPAAHSRFLASSPRCARLRTLGMTSYVDGEADSTKSNAVLRSGFIKGRLEMRRRLTSRLRLLSMRRCVRS